MQDKQWKPHPGRQEEFLSLSDSIQEGLYGGALGGGKTMILLMLPIVRGFYQHPRFQGIVFRRTFPEVEENLIPKSKEWYPLVGGKYNDTKHSWFFPSGAVIRFGYMDTDDDVRKHDGSEYQYIAYDELEHFTEYMYLQLHARNRSPVKDLPKIIRCTAMPGGIGHSWVRNRFVEPFIQGGAILKDSNTGNKRIFIPAKLTDNPSLHEDDPDYINKLRNLPIAEQKAKIDGDWWAFIGQVFSEFRIHHYSDEPESALHVIEPFEIPLWWPRIASIDWGYDAATAIYKAAISPDKRIFIYSEYVRKNEYISTWASNFRRESPEKFETVVMDPSAWHQRGDEKTIAEQFMEHSGFIVEKADNDRVGGRMLFHEMLRWKKKPAKYIPKDGYDIETANKIHRMYGTDALHDYEKMFIPEKEEVNIPKLQIFNTCTELIKTIPALVYAESRRNDKKPEDVQEFNGDDPYDSTRYLLKACDRYLEFAAEEAKRREPLEKIMADFEKSGDQTSLYQRMSRFERKARNIRGVRLFH